MKRVALFLVLCAVSIVPAAAVDVVGSWRFDPTATVGFESASLCLELQPGGRFDYVIESLDPHESRSFSVTGSYELDGGALTLTPDEGPEKLKTWTVTVSREGAGLVFAEDDFLLRFQPTPWCSSNASR